MNRESNPFSNGNLIDLQGGETDKKEISEVQNTLKYVCSKLEELGRDNFMLKAKVKDHEKYIADLTNRVESQEITINQLEQKINDAELSVEDMRLRSPVPNQVEYFSGFLTIFKLACASADLQRIFRYIYSIGEHKRRASERTFFEASSQNTNNARNWRSWSLLR